MAIRVLMTPHADRFGREESGIRRVVEAYFKYLPQFDIDLVPPEAQDFDLMAIHAGLMANYSTHAPLVSHCHGLYWTADYSAPRWEWMANANVITSLILSRAVTVPSEWVAESLRRDMRLAPTVVHHGVEWAEWQHDHENEGYILWNKNRNADVCDPAPVLSLAKRFPKNEFVSTFAPNNPSPNITAIGIRPHDEMKRIVQSAALYLSTTKETFGIGTLEALAAGVPVLGYAHGGNLDIVQHGVTGYLAVPGNEEDLAEGLLFCAKHRKVLSENARLSAKKFTWTASCEKVAEVYRQVATPDDRPYHINLKEYIDER